MIPSSSHSALNVSRYSLGCDGLVCFHDGAAGMTSGITQKEHTAVNLWRPAEPSGNSAMSRYLLALILNRHLIRR